MDFRKLRTFVTVADTLHFGRAAERLGIVQPAVTQQIKGLEVEVGVQLFERGTRAVALTSVGAEFLVEARATLAQAQRAMLVAARAQRGEVGRLEIAHVSSMAFSGILSRLLVEFAAVAPNIDVGVTEMDAEPQLEQLAEGRIDVALVRLPVAELPAGIVLKTLQREPVLACLRPDHPLANKPVAVARLAEEDFIGTHLRAGLGFFDTQLRICRDAGFEPRIVAQSRQFVTIVSLVASGRGVALVPKPVNRLKMPDVTYNPLARTNTVSEVAMAWRSDRLTPPVQRFVDLCAELEASGAFSQSDD